MLCPTAVRTTESNSKSVEVCRTPRGKNNSGSPNTIEDRSTGGLALPAVPPITVREPHTDSHRVEVRWNCKPEISNAQDSSAFTRRRMSIELLRREITHSSTACRCRRHDFHVHEKSSLTLRSGRRNRRPRVVDVGVGGSITASAPIVTGPSLWENRPISVNRRLERTDDDGYEDF